MNAVKPLLLLSASLLASCSSLKKPPELPLSPKSSPIQTASKSEQHIPINNISSWEISGAIAARNQKKSWTASLNWQQQGSNQYQIRLFGPLGGGTVIIEKQGSVITYRDGPKRISSTNADKLLLQQTGVRLPVNNLYYWVRGIPAPGAVGAEQYTNGHLLSRLQQNGYTVTYSQYTTVSGTQLPSKIRLEGPGMLIKMVIKHWKI